MKFNKAKYFYYFIFCLIVFTIFIYGGSFDRLNEKLLNKIGASVTNIGSIEEEKEEIILKKNIEEETKRKEESIVPAFESNENSISVSSTIDYNTSSSITNTTNNNVPMNTNEDNNKKEDTTNDSMNYSISSTNEMDIIYENTDTLGTYGRLFVPSVDLNVALYLADMTSNNVQRIVDNRDSAAYFDFNNQNVIADHNHQGFHKIIDISAGDFAYIKKLDGSMDIYQMINKFEGENIVYDLVDLNGNSILTGKNSLVMYTCYKMSEYDNHVMITVFQLVR